MAAFLVRALHLTDDGGGNTFTDDNGTVFEDDIAKLAAAGITKGCNPPTNNHYCPNQVVTRGQMAAFLVRALHLTDDGGGNTFTDDNGTVFEDDIAKLAAAQITKGCNPPTNNHYCPNDPVHRDQMASFLGRALGLAPTSPPPSNEPRLAYTRVVDGLAAGIEVAAIDGTGSELLTADGMRPQYSPDGSKIAFLNGFEFGLAVMNTNGSGILTLTPEAQGTVYTVAGGFSWSPDGSRLAVSMIGPSDAEFLEPSIWTIGVDGSDLTERTDTPELALTTPLWAPDDRYILVCNPGAIESSLARITPEGSSLNQFAVGNCDYSYSRDGDNVWFSSSRDGDADTGDSEIFRWRVDLLPPEQQTTDSGRSFDPEPSPDDGQFVFVRRDGDGDTEIFTKTIGNPEHQLTDNTATELQPTWSPDGDYIAFISNRTGVFEVYVMRSDGSDLVQISHGGGEDPAWAPLSF